MQAVIATASGGSELSLVKAVAVVPQPLDPHCAQIAPGEVRQAEALDWTAQSVLHVFRLEDRTSGIRSRCVTQLHEERF